MIRLGLDLLFLIPRETGGRETYARQLIAALFETEPALSVTAFANRDAGPELRRDFGPNLSVVALPVSARRPEQWAAGELALLPLAATRARVQLLHSPANFGPAWGRFRRVITLHDLQYRALPELLTPARRLGTGALIRLAAKRADRVITGSEFSAAELVSELGLPRDRIDVVPHGAGIRASGAIAEEELRSRFELGARPVALTISTALPHKNLRALLDGVAEIPAEQRPLLVIAGAGTDGEALAEHARAVGIANDARLLGYQPADVVEGLYRLASCAVMPTLYEGFGLPVLEAMAHGVPVACSDIPVLREVAGTGAVWFSPRRPTEIATAIEQLLTDAALVERLRAEGPRRAAQFSWRRAAEGTLASYRRALAGRGPRTPARASA
jgi:glycosyltransferase involved in cell wall biosynthesis